MLKVDVHKIRALGSLGDWWLLIFVGPP